MEQEIWVDYWRCSTEEQAIEGFSIETQDKCTKEIINSIPNSVYGGNYKDEGLSGSDSIDKRPDILRLLSDAKKGLFHGLAILKADRLGRLSEDREYIAQMLNKYNIKIKCHSGEILTDNSPQGIFIRKTLANVDELEVRTLSYRIRNTVRTLASNGEYKGGIAPYGFILDKESRKFVKTEPLITQAKLVWDMYLYQLKGYASIRDYFNLELKQPYFRKGKPEAWTKERVCLILRSPIYAGYQYHNTKYSKFEMSEGKTKKPKNEWELFPANFVEPIITLEEFEKAQLIKQKKREKRIPSINTSWLLTGLLYCGQCGARMGGHPHWNKSILKDGTLKKYDCSSYICTNREYKGKVGCTSKQVVKKDIESIVEEKVFQFVQKMNDYDIREIRKILQKRIEEDFSMTTNIEASIKQVDNSIAKYYRDYEKPNSPITAEILAPAIERLTKQKNQLLFELKNSQEVNKTKEEIYMEAESILKNISKWIKDYQKQDEIKGKKIKLIDLIDKIYVKDNEVNIVYKISPSSYVSECNHLQVVTPENICKKALYLINSIQQAI